MRLRDYARIMVFAWLISLFIGCSSNVDDKIGSVKTGMSVGDVIELLGKPHKAKEHPMGMLVFIYKGRANYYWVLFAPMANVVLEVKQQDSDEFYPATDVQVIVSGKRIELRRKD